MQIEVLDTTSKCGQYLLPFFHGEREEVVYLLCLDAKCKALDCVAASTAAASTSTSIAARKVVKAALDSQRDLRRRWRTTIRADWPSRAGRTAQTTAASSRRR